MSFASKYSRSTPRYNVRISHPAYTSLRDLHAENGEAHIYPICGIYINTKGQWGPQAVIAIDESLLVNMPAHLLEVCEEMRNDSETTEAINAGQAGFRIYSYKTKSGRAGYSVTWVDLTR